eukprot:11784074-Alexandrium_andersonii.AAC.1
MGCDGCAAGNVPKPWTLMRDAMDDGGAIDVRSGKRSQAVDTVAMRWMCDGLRETFPSRAHCCDVLQCVATCCNVLRCVAMCCDVFRH